MAVKKKLLPTVLVMSGMVALIAFQRSMVRAEASSEEGAISHFSKRSLDDDDLDQNDQNRPPQACPNQCLNNWNPVCGTDGRTYRNECLLRFKSCRSREKVYLQHKGACAGAGQGTLPPMNCPNQCTDNWNPVCATDGRTYRNECLLRLYSCRNKIRLQIKYKGACRNTTPEPETEPDPKPDPGQNPLCNKTCNKLFSPVCASNGKTYQNACLMVKAGCKQGTELVVVHLGVCSQGGSKRCPYKCPDVTDYICGDNGWTYKNQCEMLYDSCIKNQVIRKRYQGSCRKIASH